MRETMANTTDGSIQKSRGDEAYARMPLTMGYYTREDIPFYYALADALRFVISISARH
jgi:phospholipase C